MGNCLRANKVSAQDHDEKYEAPFEAKVEHAKTSSSSSSSKLEATPLQEQSMKKKVRFNTQKDAHSGDSRGGTVRIRVVMTQEELKRILTCNNDDSKHNSTSLEQLLSAVKLRGGRISEVGEYDDGGISSWRPALESIPEDSLIN